uniref:Uncharacterized protein n=1 Tax=Heterorhabditis bacteriophora TaxID=37862 RepID=A0A1I7WMN9_HETBA
MAAPHYQHTFEQCRLGLLVFSLDHVKHCMILSIFLYSSMNSVFQSTHFLLPKRTPTSFA